MNINNSLFQNTTIDAGKETPKTQSLLKDSGQFDIPIVSILSSNIDWPLTPKVLKLNKEIKKEERKKEKKIYIPPQFRKYQTVNNAPSQFSGDDFLIHSLTDPRKALKETWVDTSNIGKTDFPMNELNQQMDHVNVKEKLN